MGMLSHVMYTAQLLMCSLTLITLHPFSYSCMMLALPTCHPALLSVYTAPTCYQTVTPFLLPILPTLHTSPSAPSCYLHSTPPRLLPHAIYIPLCQLMLLNTVHIPFCFLMLPTLHLPFCSPCYLTLYTYPSAPSCYLHCTYPSVPHAI